MIALLTKLPQRDPQQRLRSSLRQTSDRIKTKIGDVVLLLTRHRVRTAAGTGLLWAIVGVARMLWPPQVGLGDAGDGERLLCQIGAEPPAPRLGWPSGQLAFAWEGHRYYGETCGVPSTGETYSSSQLILLRLASWLGDGIDLRVLAVICALLVGLGVGLLVLTLPASLSLPKRVLVASVAGLILVDSGIARFFASPYSEPAALLGTFLLCPALLWLLRRRRYHWGALLAVTGLGAFVIMAKTQMISFLPPLLVVLLFRPSLPSRWHHGIQLTEGRWIGPRSRFLHQLWVRGPALALAVVLTVVSFANLAGQPKRYSEINAYSQIFSTMLPMSPDPESDLRWFGLDPSLARGAGTNIYSSNTVAYDAAYAGFPEAVTEGKVVMFYVSQPGRLVKLLDAGLNGIAGYGTEKYMANHPASPGPPYAQDDRIPGLSWLTALYRAMPWLLALQWLLLVVVFAVVTRRWRGSPGRQSVGILGLFLTAAMTLQFWVVMVSEGKNEIFKHLVTVDLLTFLSLTTLLVAWLQRRKARIDLERERTA